MTRHFVYFALGTAMAAASAVGQTSYVDDDDGRRLARVDFTSVREGTASRLQLLVSADGPDVEPIPGFEGVGGANRYTAEQLERILAGSRRLTVISRNLKTGEATVGTFREGRRGRIPARVMRADGSIDYLAQSAREFSLELIVETGSLPNATTGRYETLIRVDGTPRARLLSVSSRTGQRFERFESLGGHTPADSTSNGSQAQFLALLAADAKKPKEPPPVKVDLADWEKRDVEGKWMLIQRRVAEEPASREGWVPFLVKQKEFELLEWLAIYQVDGFSSQGIGKALADADAPQWARVALWNQPNKWGHTDGEAEPIFMARPGVSLWWLRKYPDAGAAKKVLLERLEKEKVEPVESPHLLPPLKPQDVFKHLDAPAELADFGTRMTAEPAATYQHQVFRAIRGVVAAGPEQQKAVLERLRALTGHPNAAIRREAFLAFTYKYPGGVPGELSREDALRVVDDGNEPASVREAAALAFSYIDHPAVYVTLHRLAGEVDHPAWSAAVSRLGDIGDGFTRKRLAAMDTLPPKQAAVLSDAVARIASRDAQEQNKFANLQPGSDLAVKTIRARLRRAAWADLSRDPMAAELLAWATETTREQAAEHAAVRAAIDWIVREPDDEKPDTASAVDARTLRERVSAIAKTLQR